MSTQAPTIEQAKPVGPEAAREQERLALAGQARRGSSWFYWIAGLSVVNSVVIASGGSWSFVLGLGLTAGVDYIAREAVGSGLAMAWGFNAAVCASFALFGYFASRERRWAYLAGLAAYIADAALVLAARDWLGVAVHVLGLYFIWAGLSALAKRSKMDQSPAAPATP